MADPLLQGKYPVKGLYKALAVAAMCLQEEASTRPLISDVVTALEFMAVKDEPDALPREPNPVSKLPHTNDEGEGWNDMKNKYRSKSHSSAVRRSIL